MRQRKHGAAALIPQITVRYNRGLTLISHYKQFLEDTFHE
jgi:hypothetical protein